VVCLFLAVEHTHYVVNSLENLTPTLSIESIYSFLKLSLAALCFGLCARTFSISVKSVLSLMEQTIKYPPLRSFIGGTVIAACVCLLGTDKHIGLGLPTIAEAFSIPLPVTDFMYKMGLTIISLGSSFKGGEVTPLFSSAPP